VYGDPCVIFLPNLYFNGVLLRGDGSKGFEGFHPYESKGAAISRFNYFTDQVIAAFPGV
jgi:hypothetical protein